MKTKFAALVMSAIGLFVAAPAKAIDVAPGDYTITPSGTAIGLLYLQHQSADSFKP